MFAPAHDGDRAVRNEQLVVHAVVEAPQVGERGGESARGALPGAAEGIEQAHVDLRKRRGAREDGVGARRIEVVDEQALPRRRRRA